MAAGAVCVHECWVYWRAAQLPEPVVEGGPTMKEQMKAAERALRVATQQKQTVATELAARHARPARPF